MLINDLGGDAKDHAGYGPAEPAVIAFTGDAKDHAG